MHDTGSLLDAAKSRQAIPSDYKLAKALGVSQARVSGYRIGKSRPDDLTARKIAELADLDEGYVVACLHAERAQNEEARGLWEGIAKRLERAGLASVTAVFALFFFGNPDGGALAKTPLNADSAHSRGADSLSIHCRVLRWARRLVRALYAHPFSFASA